MMFSKDIVDLGDDVFEGSNDELRIFQEVFYGNAAVGCSKKGDTAGVTRSLKEHDNILEISPSSHSENSAITNEASPKDLCQKEAASAELQRDSRALSSTEGSIVDERTDHDMLAKRMRYSVNELSNFKPYLDKAVASSVPLKQVVSEAYRPVLPAPCQILMCHVVESCSEGVTSSCYLLKQYPESDPEGNLGDTNALNGSLSGSDGSEVKQVGCSKSIASPPSQESSATKLLVPSPTTVAVSESGSPVYADKRTTKVTYPECKDDEILTGESMKDAHTILRSRVYLLLERAGWSPERRIRNDGRNRYVYLSPEGKLFREFPKVWDLLGQSLDAHGNNNSNLDDKQWTNVDQFCSDLYETLKYIDNTMNDWEPKCALTCQWVLLDPFVNVVLVNRKIQALRAGNLVKAKQSNVIDMESKADVDCRLKSRKGVRKRPLNKHGEKTVCSPLASDTVKTHKTRSIYVSDGDSMRLVKTIGGTGNRYVGTCTNEDVNSCRLSACDSDSTCLQHPAYLCNVPVSTVETNAIYGQSSPHQASCMSSPSCNKQNMELIRKNSTKDSAVCLYEEGDEPLERCVTDAGMKKMDCKTAGFSGVELSKLSESKADDICLVNARSSQLKLVDVHGWSTDCVDNDANSNKFPTSFFERHNALCRSILGRSRQSRNPSDCCSEKLKVGHDTDKPLHAYDGSVESQSCKKSLRPKKRHSSKKRSMGCQPKDDDLLISAIIKKRSYRSRINACGPEPRKFKFKSLKKRKTQKGSCRLLLRNLGKGGKHVIDRWTIVGKRTVLDWLISVGAILINETVQYRDSKVDAVVKEGLITKDGILCNCCSEVFSVSKFKTHAGFNQNRLCSNLFVGSGRPYSLCQLQAWSAEYKIRRSGTRHVSVDEFDKNDDSCGLCGDGGELLCCDNCPSTFHQSCLSAEELPEGNWYCPNCTCEVCGALANDTGTSSSCAALQCSQCDKKYHQVCLTDKGMGKVGGAPWFCSSECEEVFGGLQSRIGLYNHIADDYSWTLLRCIQEDQKVPSAQRSALKAECNSKLAVAVTIMEECFLSMIDPRTGIDMIPQVVYNWGSEFARLDYHGFYTAVLEKDDVLISVASIRVHGVAVAEMPLIATCSKYRRQGMCRRLLNSIEKMLISLKVKKLVITAISDLVETWTIGFGFVPVEEDEKRSLSKINLMVFPGTVMLKKTLYMDRFADLEIGVEDRYFSALDSDASCKIGICLEGNPKIDGIYGNTEKDSVKDGGATELKVKLISSSGMKTGEAPKTAAATEVEPELFDGLASLEQEDRVTNIITGFREEVFNVPVGYEMETNVSGEREILQLGSLGMSEGSSLMSSQISAVGSEIKHVIADQSSLQDAKNRYSIKTLGCMEIPSSQNKPNGRAEIVTADKLCELPELLECINQENPLLSHQFTGECLYELVFTQKETDVVPCDVATHAESMLMEAESVSELRNHVGCKGESTSDACKTCHNIPSKLENSEAVKPDVEANAISMSKNVATEKENSEAAKKDKQSVGGIEVGAASNGRENMTINSMNLEALKEDEEAAVGMNWGEQSTGDIDVNENVTIQLMNLETLQEHEDASVGINIEPGSDMSKNMVSRLVNLEAMQEEAAKCGEREAASSRNMRGNLLSKMVNLVAVIEGGNFAEGMEVEAANLSSKIVVTKDDDAADCMKIEAASNTSNFVKTEHVSSEAVKENRDVSANGTIKLVNSEGIKNMKTHESMEISTMSDMNEVVTTHLVTLGSVEEDVEVAVEAMETGAELNCHKEISLEKSSSEQYCENDMIQNDGVSGQETQCVTVAENQLSVIEQSQQASVLPLSQ